FGIGRDVAWIETRRRRGLALACPAQERTRPWVSMLQRLFVYGTLAPGRPNAHVLADVPGTWEPARMAGRLVQEGWGAALGYPAIVPGAGEGFVEGQLFSSEVLDAHWRRL